MAASVKEENKAEESAAINVESPAKNKSKKKKKGKGKKIAFLLIFILIIAALAAVFIFNLFDIREKYLRPVLQNVPIVKNILPETQEQDEFGAMTKEQLVVEVKKMRSENERLQESNNVLNDRIKTLQSENTSLKELESQYEEFRTEREQFENMVASGDPQAYANFYEGINPEHAEELYKEAIVSTSADTELKNYVQTFENMKKDAAAKALEELVGTDMDLVVRILQNISTEQRGAILSVMDTANTAAIIKQMAPDEQQQ